MASALLPATFIDVALTDSNGLNISHHLVNIGGQVFVFGPGDAQVVWTSTFVNSQHGPQLHRHDGPGRRGSPAQTSRSQSTAA